MSDSTRLRTSCDRCQASKVKCSRVKPSCWRCNELGQDCIYSPVKRIGRPRNEAQTLRVSSLNSLEQRMQSAAQPTSPAMEDHLQQPMNHDELSSGVLDPEIMIQCWPDEDMQQSCSNDLQPGHDTPNGISSEVDFDACFNPFIGTDMQDKLQSSMTSAISTLPGSSTMSSAASGIISDWHGTSYGGEPMTTSAGGLQSGIMPSNRQSMVSVSDVGGSSDSRQQAHDAHTSRTFSRRSSKARGAARMRTTRKSCYIPAWEAFDKFNEDLPEGEAIPLDKLLNQYWEMKRALDGVLGCQCPLSCATSPTMVMLLLIMFETSVGQFEKQLTASTGDFGGTGVQRSLPTDMPLVVGSFVLDARMKEEFLARLIADAVDAQLSMLLQLEAKANDVLKGMFRENAEDILVGTKQRLALLRESF